MQCVMCGKTVVSESAVRCWWCNHKHRSSAAAASLEVRAQEIRRLKASGMTMVDIARKLGISRQRAYQILGRKDHDGK
jgi:DNA-binding NarL/FixJ family response regulator